jgi:hypothetical protein
MSYYDGRRTQNDGLARYRSWFDGGRDFVGHKPVTKLKQASNVLACKFMRMLVAGGGI